MDNISELLGLEDSNIFISESSVSGNRKTIVLETPACARLCPCCGARMHSRGIKKRSISHPDFQGGYELMIILKQRRWRCTDPDCAYTCNEDFSFVDKRRRSTNAADEMIVSSFRDLSVTASDIAKRFNTSDTHVLDIFHRYVKPDRLPLTDIISIDLAYTGMSGEGKHALLIQDFLTGAPIDLIQTRPASAVSSFFSSVPAEERGRVNYVLIDMTDSYAAAAKKYFPNAKKVIDPLHVLQQITQPVSAYIHSLEKEIRRSARNTSQAASGLSASAYGSLYILREYRDLILADHEHIHYDSSLRMDPRLHRLMNTYMYEEALFKISPRHKVLRDLKDIYTDFSKSSTKYPERAADELNELISLYSGCGDSIFEEFAQKLEKYREAVLNYFYMIEKYGCGEIYEKRNYYTTPGAANRKLRDLTLLGRGLRNFEHLRNRFLFAERKENGAE